MKLTDHQKQVIKTQRLDSGEALYLHRGEIFVGRDGCQPSNSACIAVGPWAYQDADVTMDEIEDNLPGYFGNQNAAKNPDESAKSFLHIRCTAKQKAGWVKSAQRQGKKLSEWVIDRLGE